MEGRGSNCDMELGLDFIDFHRISANCQVPIFTSSPRGSAQSHVQCITKKCSLREGREGATSEKSKKKSKSKLNKTGIFEKGTSDQKNVREHRAFKVKLEAIHEDFTLEAPVGKLGALGRTDKATWHTLGLVGKHLKRMGKVVLAFSARVHIKRDGGIL